MYITWSNVDNSKLCVSETVLWLSSIELSDKRERKKKLATNSHMLPAFY